MSLIESSRSPAMLDSGTYCSARASASVLTEFMFTQLRPPTAANINSSAPNDSASFTPIFILRNMTISPLPGEKESPPPDPRPLAAK